MPVIIAIGIFLPVGIMIGISWAKIALSEYLRK